ncbi:MAG: protein translocase subunit SecD [Candidatus Omnitrophica bacterium]|nr:protein translocase subunit SecD [Candidatus Omnitrophota bacterium]
MFPSSFKWRIPVVAVVLGWAVWFAFPLSQRIALGLDLQGGMHLVLRVDTSKLPPSATQRDVAGVAVEILRNRIDQFGVREPLIQRQGTDHILVQLPGITDRERALKLLGQTAMLEFRLASDNSEALERALNGDVVPGYELREMEDGSPILLEHEGVLTGEILSDAYVEPGEMGLPEVSFQLNKEGAKAFSKLTGDNVGRRLAIVLDGTVQSAPVIQSRISDAGRITGRFTRQEANDLAIVLRAGALPAPIVVEEERTVGPMLGKDSIRAGLTSTAIGAALIALFMAGYYWVAGMVAVTALLLNVLLILGSLGYLHATLTLPGIAGIILTLGMAVDANVLIYERIREELAAGRPLSLAVGAGYEKAFSAIVDSNLTTVVAAVFLYWFGTGPIRGFATTLIAGLLASMFTAVFVTRVIFDVLLASPRFTKLPMAHLIPTTRMDFIGKRGVCYALSGVVILVGVMGFLRRGPERYGIDFTGGLLQEYRFSAPVGADQLRGTLAKVGLEDAVIQEFGSPSEWLIRTPDDAEAEIQDAMTRTREALVSDYGQQAAPELVRLERVGPTVGEILRTKAWLAIAWSMLGILIYVAVRFRHVDFAIAGVVALVHDVMVAVGFMCLTNRSIDLITVAALLTIAGFSINDTIVIYDRVRENMRLSRKMSLAEIINLSVNQCMGRTLLTSLTVVMAVLALYWFGGDVLHDFAFCLLVGFMSGVYSTVYIASALVISWQRLFKPAVARG